MSDFFKAVQQAQEITGRLKSIQEKLEQLTLTGSAGGGLVSVDVDGRGNIRGIRIDPSVVRSDDVEMLEDLLVSAVSEAQRKASDAASAEMAGVTGGLQLPFKLPF